MTGPSEPPTGDGDDLPEITVVIACHTFERLHLLDAAVRSAQTQTLPPAQVVVVVDHNRALARHLADRWVGVTVVENDRVQGASGARNTGASIATTEYVAFLDDDTRAESQWLANLVEGLSSADAVGAGGRVVPDWTAPPWWFPEEFNWVVGATYVADQVPTVVRNVWAESMIVRAEDFSAVGGFRASFGKSGDRGANEDTELCIRMAAATGGHWLYVPDAVVVHHVPLTRATYRFFLGRCVEEGKAKADLAAIVPRSSAVLATEREYVRRILPRAFAAHLAGGAQPRPGGLARGVNLAVGLSATVYGYAAKRLQGQGTLGPIIPPGPAEPIEAALT